MSFAAQARREIGSAYKPAFKALNRQERRVRAQDRRQKRDERAFQNWLRDTNAQLNADAAHRDAQLQGVQAQYQQQAQAALGKSASDAQSRSGAAPVGATPQAIGVTGAYVQGEAAAHGADLAGQQRIGSEMTHSVEANSYAFVAAQRAQRRLAVLDAISKIADQRGDLHAKKAADVAKRSAELEQAAAEAALQQQKLEYAAQQDAIQNDLAQQRIDATLSGQDLTRRGQNMTARQRAADRRLRRRLAKTGAAGSKGASPSQIARAQEAVGNASAALSQALGDKSVKKHGYDKPKNWKLLVRHLVANYKTTEAAAIVAVAKHYGHGIDRVPSAWKTLVNSQASSR